MPARSSDWPFGLALATGSPADRYRCVAISNVLRTAWLLHSVGNIFVGWRSYLQVAYRAALSSGVFAVLNFGQQARIANGFTGIGEVKAQVTFPCSP